MMSQADLVEALEDELYGLRSRLGEKAFPKSAQEYLNDWAANDKGWLRKFYRHGTDEPYFDLMPATEKTIAWLGNLAERSFVGTESRLLTLFALLKQMTEGAETDEKLRIAELQKRRDAIDLEIRRLRDGDISLLDDTAIKDRFQQFTALARELLGDFREVEYNFRGLDRKARERIALWEGGKGKLLEELMGDRDEIASSDQGKSFRAFWDFLMSSSRQEELSTLVEKVLTLPAVTSLSPDPRTRRVHYDWLEAGEHTQRTVAQLSEQLRRFLDDKAWLENRRIIEILRSIEGRGVALAKNQITGEIMQIAAASSDVDLPMERPLYTHPLKPKITSAAIEAGDDDIDAAALFAQVIVDKQALAKHIRQSLQERSQITLAELVEHRPLAHGLAEVVTYLQLSSEQFESVVDEDTLDSVSWTSNSGNLKRATLPRIIFVR